VGVSIIANDFFFSSDGIVSFRFLIHNFEQDSHLVRQRKHLFSSSSDLFALSPQAVTAVCDAGITSTMKRGTK
jgi:hypothetical protein